MAVPIRTSADADPHAGTGWLHEMFSGNDLRIGCWTGVDADPGAGPKDRMTDLLTTEAGVTAGRHLLDLAAGRGGPAVRAAQRTGAVVTGLIADETDLAAARAWAADCAVPELATFRQADPAELPFADASFDAAWAAESGAISDSGGPAVLGELRRVLRPSGTLVFADYVQCGPLTPAQRDVLAAGFGVTGLPTAGDARAALTRAGFTVRKEIDLTAHMRRSARRSAKLVEAGHDRIARRAGADFAAAFRERLARIVRLKLERLGYVLLTVTRGNP